MSDAHSPPEDAKDTSKSDERPPEMESWAAVQNEMHTHDAAMVKDYAEDIDNLLVFAGLFSASLTAFLVESYTMLQEDNEETSKQYLARISTQLESFKLNPGFANSTNVPPLPVSPFQPSRTAVWVNSLWFLSLLFTLSAAFFGIRVRQWLREYMRWNDALANPRENVLVRQVRFVALNDWKVLGSISGIPALLEFALVLFVSGVVILTWTLNSTVATIVSIAVALLLFTTLIITILPVCCKRCPYRSPTAWACLFLWSFIRDTFTLVYWRTLYEQVQRYRRHDDDNDSPSIMALILENLSVVSWISSHPHSWRHRDIQSVYVWEMLDFNDQTRSMSTVLDAEVSTEMNVLALHDSLGQPARVVPSTDFDKEDIARDMGQTVWLFRALVWVMQSSEDHWVHRHALRCTETIHAEPYPDSPYYPACWPSSHIADLYLLTRPWMPASVPRYIAYMEPSVPNIGNLPALRQFLKLWYEPCSRVLDKSSPGTADRRLCLADRSPGHFLLSSPASQGQYEEVLMSHILSADLVHLVTHCLPSAGTDYAKSGADKIFELLVALFLLFECAPHKTIAPVACAHNALADYAASSGFKFPGVAPALFETLYSTGGYASGYVDIDEEGMFTEKSIRRASGMLLDIDTRMTPGTTKEDLKLPCLKLANFFHGRIMSGQPDIDDMYIFVWSADLALGKRQQDDLLLSRMVDVAQQALQCSYMNCGFWDDLPWFYNFIDVTIGKDRVRDGPPFDAYPPLFDLCTPSPEPFRRLIRVLRRSHKKGLLTGQIIWKLPYLRRLAAIPQTALESREATEAWIKTVPPPSIDDLMPGGATQSLAISAGASTDSSATAVATGESWVPSMELVLPPTSGVASASTSNEGPSNSSHTVTVAGGPDGQTCAADTVSHSVTPEGSHNSPEGKVPMPSKRQHRGFSGPPILRDRIYSSYSRAHNDGRSAAVFSAIPAKTSESELAKRRYTLEPRQHWFNIV